jgi:hypothetical protein
LREVVHATSPHLAAAELEPLFRLAKGSACWKALDEPGRHRLSLLEAINARDPAAMRTHARALLEQNDPEDRAHHFVSAVAADLALGDRAGARALVQRYFPSLTTRERASLIVRFVVSLAA